MTFIAKMVLSFGLSLLLAATVAAQGVFINSPAAGANIVRGWTFFIEISRPPFLSSVAEVAIVVHGLQTTTPFKALYDPVRDPSAPPNKPPSQTFEIAIPVWQPTGPVTLFVTHFSLLGAALAVPFVETLNITLNVLG